MRSTLTPSARASAGARLMDRHDHQWYDVVNLDRFDIDNPYGCVIGQVTGSFDNLFLIKELTPSGVVDVRQWLTDHGFLSIATPGEEDDYEDPGDKAELERAWRHEIAMRRTLAPLAHALLAEAAA